MLQFSSEDGDLSLSYEDMEYFKLNVSFSSFAFLLLLVLQAYSMLDGSNF